ncbi:nuclear transport factor 2 family protein [Streptomyces sp. NA02950]|uniref:nuclear transport factor 2 family protein n=1 Tax=Streptomyces sp. NA02950 TaxID=2742137 RepID=UPI0015900110|nr:nuclear transport factor 2 family protein [Streptomyces sp. NA02950]QKV93134.1 nuclear transport factor 2 family protein [Streptomyces sp. NA02950]
MTCTDAGTDTVTAPAAAVTERTRAAVQELLGRLVAGDPERIAALFAERVDWQIAENPAAWWIRPRSTRADVAAHFRDLAEGVQPYPDGNTVDAVVVDGPEAVLTGTLAGIVRATGRAYHSPFAMRLTVENGLITRYRVYEDSLAIAAACAPVGQEPPAI